MFGGPLCGTKLPVAQQAPMTASEPQAEVAERATDAHPTSVTLMIKFDLSVGEATLNTENLFRGLLYWYVYRR